MKKTLELYAFLLSITLVFTADAFAQDVKMSPQRLLYKADSLRMAYDFQGAALYCEKAIAALDSTKTSKAQEQLTAARNGLSMMDYCSRPKVVARRRFPLKDFFLFYPLADRSWRKTPNQLDPDDGKNALAATFYPENAGRIYYSAKDEDGIRNIYCTSRGDSLWSAPQLINEQVTSSSDEIFPMLSPDGKKLYFASKGLYGMGGYDLYVSEWNEDSGDWGVPENMGIPYSSPYDDFLFIDTSDGKYSIFASNRDCRKDSVYIYVLEYDEIPLRKAVSNVKELRELSFLAPERNPTRMDNASAVQGNSLQSEGTELYASQMKVVRSLRDSVDRFGASIDKLRAQYMAALPEDKPSLAKAISEKEILLPELNDTLSRAVKTLQDIEMDFLLKGVVIDSQKLQAEADKEVVGAASGYTFTKNNYGGEFTLEMMTPKSEFDYSFMILGEGRFAENNNLPDGIVYQIQIFTVSSRATVSDIGGLSPVFEKKNPTGTYTYSVGLFRTYKDVLSNLNKVKSRGFPTAFITAFQNGKSIGIPEARRKESQVEESFIVKIHPGSGGSLPETALAVIRQMSEGDLIKSVENGSVVYKVGPFDNKGGAEKLVVALKAVGMDNVFMESSGN